ncbi:MAG: phage minor head protein [Eubacteriales bacterium]|nr:phage minor head protein [Eubacteriales bacterium]
MTFLIRPPHRLKKRRSKNAQEILDRLKRFLDQNTDEPAEILYSFWEDQRNAITYHELRDAVKEGSLSQKQFEEWQQDYSVLVAEKLTPIWEKAMAAGPAGQPIFDSLSFSINTQNPGIANWIKERGAEFVTSCTAEQKKAMRSLLAKKVVEEHTVDELARLIRPCIGLTDGDAKATMRLYDKVVDNLKTEHPRMKPENVRKKALDAAQKYAEKKHRQRAYTIAQTELEFAYNRGADQGVRQAQEDGLLGTMKKRWITSGDDAVCPTCAALDGTEIEMDDNFDFKGRLLFVGQKMLPPAHPKCACAVEYIEIGLPTF